MYETDETDIDILISSENSNSLNRLISWWNINLTWQCSDLNFNLDLLHSPTQICYCKYCINDIHVHVYSWYTTILSPFLIILYRLYINFVMRERDWKIGRQCSAVCINPIWHWITQSRACRLHRARFQSPIPLISHLVTALQLYSSIDVAGLLSAPELYRPDCLNHHSDSTFQCRWLHKFLPN